MVQQREQNPDVNSRQPSNSPAEDSSVEKPSNSNTDVERGPNDDVIPVPPDSEPVAPIEEPPGTDGPPVGEVDDSPKQIAG